MSQALEPATVAAAAQALSGVSRFWFTRRGLMFELCRAGAWPEPGPDLDGCERDFAEALTRYEANRGALDRLVRPEQAVPGIAPDELERYDLPADLFDYAIARVALIERLDLCLMLIANGFHRGIEVALCVPPRFPSHVWDRIHAQLDGGLQTTFLTIHDYSPSSGPWLEAVGEQLRAYEAIEVVPSGLTMPWLSRLELPLRGQAPGEPGGGRPGGPPGGPPSGPPGGLGPDRAPSYALIEELPPLRAMRWVYGRIARGAEDIGFG